MGCGGSKDSVHGDPGKDFDDLTNLSTAHLPTTGPLSAKDYKARLASSNGTQTVYFPQTGITLRYAFVSQRGYYPGAPDKHNQDSLCVHTHFGGNSDQAFFGVFDGHGEYGTQCSQFAKDKVPENLLASTHFSVSPEIAYHRAMVLTNNQLHRLPDVDDSMSGTTAITLLVRGRTLYVANVGDSRAVLAERQGDRLLAHDLSFDQTPFRRDECERVKRCGARVLTLDQLEGLKDPNVEYWGTEEENDGDPPRLWAPNATYPGTAFTRSIGDSAAERIGVFAEPEVVSRGVSAANPFIVLASDGVWEFLPSQSVIDMVSKFDDPQEACLSVVAESYRLWLQHETRTDDITMLVVQLQGCQDDTQVMSLPTPTGAYLDYSSRPGSWAAGTMRKLPPMRMAPIEAMPVGLGTAMLMPALSSKLPPHTVEHAILQALQQQQQQQQQGGGLQGLGAGQGQQHLTNGIRASGNGVTPSTASGAALSPQPGGAGLQGSGALKERQQLQPGGVQGQGAQPPLQVEVEEGALSAGEVALLDRAMSHNFLFAGMSLRERAAVYACMQKAAVQAGQLIIRQGDPGNHFYVVQSGLFDVYLQQAPGNPPELVHTYGTDPPSSPLSADGQPGQPGSPGFDGLLPPDVVPASFGELALLYSKPRAATVVARTDGCLWSLSRDDFRAALQAAAAGPRDLAPIVKALRSVEVLQCLASSELTTLASHMQEVQFGDGQFIVRQGEEGNHFYMVHAGQVLCTVKKNLDDPHEVPKEVLRLSSGQYFGERALLSAAKRAANVVAAGGPATLLTISRADCEACLGASLQAVMAAEAEWHTQLASQREVLAHRRTTTALHVHGGGLELDALVARGLLFATDCSALMLMEHKASEEIFTVRVISIGDVVAAGKQALVMRARDISRGLEPCCFVPGVLHSFRDNCILAEVLQTVGLCTLDMLMGEGPLDEQSACFVAASVVLGLEHLRWSHILFRGLSVHTLMVTEGGQVQLVDFRFARRDEGRAYTLCGNPEYLAPEQVEQRGHSMAADLWALGVLIHCLLTGDTPFAQPGDDELRIYRRICAREHPPPLAPGLSPTVTSLLSGLLEYDPSRRLGAGPTGFTSLKAHPWFAPIDWAALSEHRFPPPPGIRERIYNFEGVAYAHFEPQPFDGDTKWCDNF